MKHLTWLARRTIGLLVLLLAATVYGPGRTHNCTDWPVTGGMTPCPHAAPLNATQVLTAHLRDQAITQGWTCPTNPAGGWYCIPPHTTNTTR